MTRFHNWIVAGAICGALSACGDAPGASGEVRGNELEALFSGKVMIAAGGADDGLGAELFCPDGRWRLMGGVSQLGGEVEFTARGVCVIAPGGRLCRRVFHQEEGLLIEPLPGLGAPGELRTVELISPPVAGVCDG